MKSLFLALTLTSAVAFAATTETKDFDAKTIREVDVENTTGSIKITGTDDARATVIAEKIKFDDKCRLEILQKGDKLSVDVDRKGFGGNSKCEVNLTLTVPRNVEVNVENGSGNFELSGTHGEVDYSLGSGNVNIDAQVIKLEGKSGSGSSTVTGLTGEAEVKTGSGNTNLTYSSVPPKGELSIKSGSGNTTVLMPAEAKIKASLVSGSGSILNEIGDHSDSRFKVSLRTGSGSISIKKAQ
ncbi:MAG: hypothetical protein KF789_07635 [Bdellovibrionaceae bacterium]|nr:hypothetical protein [Pseudobdellovibrionaceae bacterium]